MEIIYWTKIEKVLENEVWVSTGKYEQIKEEERGFVPDGDGFQVDMNGISYEEYLNNIEKYEIINGKLVEIIEQDIVIEPVIDQVYTGDTIEVINNM